MPIKPKIVAAVQEIAPPPRRRAPVQPVAEVEVPSTDNPATIATFVVCFTVQDTTLLYSEAIKHLQRHKIPDDEITESLCANGMVDVGACLTTLLGETIERLAERTACPLVEAPDVYLEPTKPT